MEVKEQAVEVKEQELVPDAAGPTYHWTNVCDAASCAAATFGDIWGVAASSGSDASEVDFYKSAEAGAISRRSSVAVIGWLCFWVTRCHFSRLCLWVIYFDF